MAENMNKSGERLNRRREDLGEGILTCRKLLTEIKNRYLGRECLIGALVQWRNTSYYYKSASTGKENLTVVYKYREGTSNKSASTGKKYLH
jgi:hypothetical protein